MSSNPSKRHKVANSSHLFVSKLKEAEKGAGNGISNVNSGKTLNDIGTP